MAGGQGSSLYHPDSSRLERGYHKAGYGLLALMVLPYIYTDLSVLDMGEGK